MPPNHLNSAQSDQGRLQVLPAFSYHIRRLLRSNIQSFQLPFSSERAANPLNDLDATLAFLYSDPHEMNRVVLQLEQLILSLQNIRVYEKQDHPGLQAIEREIFWWLGYESQAVSRTILAVDDVSENCQLISGILKPQGYNVYNASSGKMALSLLEEIQPNLILLDVRMPDMSGYQVFQILQQTDRLRSIPVIFLSALNTVEDQQKAKELGAVDFIVKPFKPSSMLERVQHHLNLQSSSLQPQETIGWQSHMETRRNRISHLPHLLCHSTKDNATEGEFQATLDGRYLRVSSGLAQLCGYPSPEGMVSEVTNLWKQIYGNPLHRDAWNYCIAHPNQMIQFEPQIHHPDGRVLQAVEHVQAVQDVYSHFLLYEGSIKIK